MSAITPPTPENVAEMLTSGDNDYHDGNDWWPSLSRDGNVVRIGIEPVGQDYETKLPEVHFQALVVEAPSVSTATANVVLDVPTARELAYSDPGDSIDGWTVVAKEEIDHSRWESIHQLVIRNEAGEHFSDTFRCGLTERQDTGPYEYETKATFTPVVPKFKVVTEWVSAKAAQTALQDGAL